MISRRNFLIGAPALVAVTSLMPVKAWIERPRLVVTVPAICNPINAPLSIYRVSPGEVVYRGDLLVVLPNGYVRPAIFGEDWGGVIAMVGSHEEPVALRAISHPGAI